MMAILGSTIFKAVGGVAIIGVVILGIMLGVTKGKLHFAEKEIATLHEEVAKAEADAATWKTVSEMNRNELERLTVSLENAKRRAEAESLSLKKAREVAEASYRKLKSEIADAATTDDRNLGPVGQRGYRGLRERHVQSAP